jgi:hypothetical protein
LGEGVGMRGIIVSESCPIISEIYHTHTHTLNPPNA